jgi:hypothetical protein
MCGNFSYSHSSGEAKVPESSVLATLKDLPLKAVPFVIFLAACGVFGELLLRMPTVAWPHIIASWVLLVFTLSSGILFFLKCFFGWPPMHGLDLVD